jgi:hypothetical protein
MGQRGDGMRFVVQADEKLTASMELEAAIRTRAQLASLAPEILSKLGVAKLEALRELRGPSFSVYRLWRLHFG